jgi:predicted dehydrogenase
MSEQKKSRRSNISRRDFIDKASRTTVAGAAATLGLASVRSASASVHDTIRAGVIGLKGRGQNHMGALEGLEGVEVVALCDVDETILNQRGDELDKRTSRQVSRYVDLRKLLDDQSIDVVSIATPNHWHSLASIWACQAGKDVYVEKPCSHNVCEGRQLVNAARVYDRIVQHGTQIRSSKAIQEAMQMLHDGIIGDVYHAKGLCYKWRNTIGRKPDEQPPAGAHYDLWLGPAPQRAFSQNRWHYQWHWHWDYGNGDIGNQGVHQMDIARWGLGVGLPSRVQSMGGKFMFDDDQETPNSMISTFEYPHEDPTKKKMLSFEVRHWMTNQEASMARDGGNGVGNIFLGSEGVLEIPSYSGYQFYFGRKGEKGPGRNEGGDHFANFIDAVRQHDRSILNAEIEQGHLSAALCHYANVAYRTGRTLEIDPGSEKCGADDVANSLLTREYREPYVVPGIA